MHIHIAGVCGTFMGGLAAIAKAMGHQVSGSDANCYPPMSTQLESLGIELHEGIDAEALQHKPDLVLIGNALSRGNSLVEYVLNNDIPYQSGPQWLRENVLDNRWVIAVSGTHGKTTTASMLAWILEHAGMNPGFLIGGVPANFGVSARYTDSSFFVIEADEYDTAFFDKRSKFVHYKPRTLVLNNLEYDHADIFPDLAAIQQQFHHLIRTVPSEGLIVYPRDESAIDEVLRKGCWTPTETLQDEHGWHVLESTPGGESFTVGFRENVCGKIDWSLLGEHNQQNALAAIAAAQHAGVAVQLSLEALSTFQSVKRRLECLIKTDAVALYDDFAHHPTAIGKTLSGLKRRADGRRVVAIVDPRSNSMRLGAHREALIEPLKIADRVFLYKPDDLKWDIGAVAQAVGKSATVHSDIDALQAAIIAETVSGDDIVLMSNGAFGGLGEKLLEHIKTAEVVV